MFKLPIPNFSIKKSLLVILIGIAIGIALSLAGYSNNTIALVYLLIVLIHALFAFRRTIKRASDYEKFIKQFGVAFDSSVVDFDKMVVAPIPYQNGLVMIKLLWTKDGIVFGKKNTYRELKLSEFDEVRDFEYFGQTTMHVKLIGGCWEDNLYLPVDVTYKND